MKRVKEVREAERLTQDKFSARIGIKRNSLANIELGRRTPSNQVILSICREFNVREEWLRHGIGAMREETTGTVIEELSVKYDLSEIERQILTVYMELPKSLRDLFMDTISVIINDYKARFPAMDEKAEELLDGLTKEEYIKQAAQEAEKQAEVDWEQAKKGKKRGSNTA